MCSRQVINNCFYEREELERIREKCRQAERGRDGQRETEIKKGERVEETERGRQEDEKHSDG